MLLRVFLFIFIINNVQGECHPRNHIVSSLSDVFIKNEKSFFQNIFIDRYKNKRTIVFLDLFKNHIKENYFPFRNYDKCRSHWTLITKKTSFYYRSIKDIFNYQVVAHSKLILNPMFQDTAKFKREQLERILSTTDTKFILVGSVYEKDYLAYKEQLKTNDKLDVLYLYNGFNVVDNKVKPFVTPLEIAVHEFEKGRLSEKTLIYIAEAVLEIKINEFMPREFECKLYEVQVEKEISRILLNKLRTKILSWCHTFGSHKVQMQ